MDRYVAVITAVDRHMNGTWIYTCFVMSDDYNRVNSILKKKAYEEFPDETHKMHDWTWEKEEDLEVI